MHGVPTPPVGVAILWGRFGSACRLLGYGLLIVAALPLIRPATGQETASFGWAPADTLRADFDAPPVLTRTPRPVPVLKRSAGGAAFEVEYVGFPPEARDAFQLAVDVWSERVETTVPIRVLAEWKPALDENGNPDPQILGLTRPRVNANFELSPQRDTWFVAALADALAGRDLALETTEPDTPDISTEFNSAFPSWYFGLDANPPDGDFDLVTVVLHELGHGLGFVGSMTVAGEVGSWGLVSNTGARYPVIYDRFAERGDGTTLLSLPNFSATLADALTSRAVLFDGPTARAQGAGLPELYAPDPWQPGSSYSHLDEAAYPAGTANALMTPNFRRGEATHDPGPLVCGALRDIGWMLSAACSVAIPLEDLLVGDVLALGASVEGDEVVITFRLPGGTGLTSGVLERRTGDTFEPVVNVDFPALDPDQDGSYEVSVADLGPGSYRFRLRLFGEAGTEFVSPLVSVVLEAFSVYPNPFNGTATVQLLLAEEQAGSVRVYDARGRRVLTLLDGRLTSTTVPLDGRGLAAGVYFVRVEGEDFSATQALTVLR